MAHEAGTGDSGPGRLGLEGWTGIRPAKEELRVTLQGRREGCRIEKRKKLSCDSSPKQANTSPKGRQEPRGSSDMS